jgi:hypothetical protein
MRRSEVRLKGPAGDTKCVSPTCVMEALFKLQKFDFERSLFFDGNPFEIKVLNFSIGR